MKHQSQKSKYKILFHIGAGKTGSTALQNMLYKDRHLLNEYNVFYLDNQIHAQQIQSGNGGKLFQLLIKGATRSEIEQELVQFMKPNYLSIISNELLAHLPKAAWQVLIESLKALDTEFHTIAYIRSPIGYYLSAYGQMVKRGGYFEDLDHFIKEHRWAHLEMLKTLCEFRSEIDLRVVPYEQNKRRLFASFWDEVLELSGINFSHPSHEDPFLTNRSLRLNEVNMIRKISKIYGGAISALISDFLVNEVKPNGEPIAYTSNQIKQIVNRHQTDLDWVNDVFFDHEVVIQNNIDQHTTLRTELDEPVPYSEPSLEVCFFLLRHFDELAAGKVSHLVNSLKRKLSDSGYFTSNPDGSQFDNVHYLLNNLDVIETNGTPFDHYRTFGKSEDRESKMVNAPSNTTSIVELDEIPKSENLHPFVGDRTAFAQLALSKGAVLEIGPFASPLLFGDQVSYADVSNTHELQERAFSLNLDFRNVPNIDFVVEPNNLDIIDKKFDAVLSSHCIEHQPDLVTHLEQVSNLLSAGGCYFLMIPDHRFCFDHFQKPSTIAEILGAYSEKRRRHGVASLIEHRALTTHNDAARHWRGDHGDQHVDLKEKISGALAEFNNVPSEVYIDVHAWYFTPESFSTNILLLGELGQIHFDIEQVYQTATGQLEFFAILRKKD